MRPSTSPMVTGPEGSPHGDCTSTSTESVSRWVRPEPPKTPTSALGAGGGGRAAMRSSVLLGAGVDVEVGAGAEVEVEERGTRAPVGCGRNERSWARMSFTARTVPPTVPVTLLRPVLGRYGTGRSAMRPPGGGRGQDHLERPARTTVAEAEAEQRLAAGGAHRAEVGESGAGAAAEVAGQPAVGDAGVERPGAPLGLAGPEDEVGGQLERPGAVMAVRWRGSMLASQSMKHTTSVSARVSPAKQADAEAAAGLGHHDGAELGGDLGRAVGAGRCRPRWAGSRRASGGAPTAAPRPRRARAAPRRSRRRLPLEDGEPPAADRATTTVAAGPLARRARRGRRRRRTPTGTSRLTSSSRSRRASDGDRRRPRRVDLDHGPTRVGHQPGEPAQEADRVTADADVAVEEQDRGPPALAGQGVEHRPLEHGGAQAARRSRWRRVRRRRRGRACPSRPGPRPVDRDRSPGRGRVRTRRRSTVSSSGVGAADQSSMGRWRTAPERKRSTTLMPGPSGPGRTGRPRRRPSPPRS